MIWAVPYSTRDSTQRQAAGVDGRRPAHGRRHLGEERAPDEAAALRGLELRRQERGAVVARLRRDRARQDAEARRRQAGRAVAGTDAEGAGHDLQLRPRDRLRRVDGRRRGLRPLGVQPRVAGLPPARLGLQADVLLGGARPRLRLHVAAERRAARRGGPGDRRGVDADQPQQHRRVPGDDGVRADLVEERPVGAAVQAGGRQGGREVGAAARHHDADHPRSGAGAGRVVHAHRRADPGVLGVREERRHRRSGLHSPHPRPQRRRHRGPQRARRSVRDAVGAARSTGRAGGDAGRTGRSRRAPPT